jgi:[acyl-carrier-protein] S-malonyltransferase
MRKIAFLFPGQGAQYVGMAKNLVAQSVVAKQVFEEAGDAIGINMMKLCFESPIDELTRTENTQPAILTATMAMYRAFAQEHPDMNAHFMAGHSLGEYSALTAAGAMQFTDAVRIVRKRGQLMQQAVANAQGGMYAIGGLQAEKVVEICRSISTPAAPVSVSGFNSAHQTVISGNKNAVEKAAAQCAAAGAKTNALKVSAPFHTVLMQPAASALRHELEQYTFSRFNTTVIANVDGLPYSSEQEVTAKLTDQLTGAVHWTGTIQYMLKQKTSFFLEIGPGKTLKNLLHGYASIEKFAVDEENGTDGFIKSVHRSVKSISSVVTKCLATAASARNYNWNEEAYEKGVAVPYESLRALQLQLETEGRLPAKEEAFRSVSMLENILSTKGTPHEHITGAINNILKENGILA